MTRRNRSQLQRLMIVVSRAAMNNIAINQFKFIHTYGTIVIKETLVILINRNSRAK
jgi:hypothetical protein